MHTHACTHVHANTYTCPHTHWRGLIPPSHTETISEREYLQYLPETYTLVQRTRADEGRNHLILNKVELIQKQ